MCECGCGTRTAIARCSDRTKGWIKGQPLRFALGHNGRQPLASRFWSKVDRSGGWEACWPWQSRRSVRGYGAFTRGDRPVAAHRVAYEMTVGPIGAGLNVLHACDNPPCVNPAHLFVGTQRDNMLDCQAKGRMDNGLRSGRIRRGEQKPHSKLTDAAVLEIRRRLAAGDSHRVIAAAFGVSHPVVGGVARGRTWMHVV